MPRLASQVAITDNGSMMIDPTNQLSRFNAESLSNEALQMRQSEPLLAGLIDPLLKALPDSGKVYAALVTERLNSSQLDRDHLHSAALSCFSNPLQSAAANADLSAIVQRDSACQSALHALLFSKGFCALQGYRVAHKLWQDGQLNAALLIQHTISCQLGVDIHPAAVIGCGVMLDHATGVVIGETARVEDNVSIMQGVTLGGTGKESGDRHPKVGRDVLLGPGAKILGNINIGTGAMVAAAAVVLKDVQPHSVVAGVPAKWVGRSDSDNPAELMEHYFQVAQEERNKTISDSAAN
ncbi:serine O-acetyltransferase [Porticoccaceae bacterium]|nr:serine O-acetyltransferase [Porticoccaceae bacterium]